MAGDVMIYLLRAALNIVVLFMVWLTSGFAAAFVDESGNLPKWLSWYQTTNSNCFGADGDVGFRDTHASDLDTWEGRHHVCWLWLNRNKANGFRERILGFTIRDGRIIRFEKTTDKYSWDLTIVINRPTSLMWLVNGVAWQWHGSWYWSSTKRSRGNFGYKLNELDKRDTVMIVFSPSPYCNR